MQLEIGKNYWTRNNWVVKAVYEYKSNDIDIVVCTTEKLDKTVISREFLKDGKARIDHDLGDILYQILIPYEEIYITDEFLNSILGSVNTSKVKSEKYKNRIQIVG